MTSFFLHVKGQEPSNIGIKILKGAIVCECFLAIGWKGQGTFADFYLLRFFISYRH